jgi:hypothetical protein
MYAQVYIRPNIEIVVGLLGQYSIVEYARNQELQIHLPFGGVYSGLTLAICVDCRVSSTEDAISRLQLLHIP